MDVAELVDGQVLRGGDKWQIEVKTIDAEKRTITFLGTTGDEDRMGDVIEPAGWLLDNFNKNPVFLWGHRQDLPPIGKVLSVTRSAQGLRFEVEFAPPELFPFADTIFKLFQNGFLNAVSVGFLPKKFEAIFDEDGFLKGFRFIEQELLELSAVSVPANPEALISEAVSGTLAKEAREFINKSFEMAPTLSDRVQAVRREVLLAQLQKENKMPKKQASEEVKAASNTDTHVKDEKNLVEEKTIDKRIEFLENEVKELRIQLNMQQKATEVFDLAGKMFEAVLSKQNDGVNPFLNVLAPGDKPSGEPKDNSKQMIDSIESLIGKFKTKTEFTPNS